jgi:hypothetical protein
VQGEGYLLNKVRDVLIIVQSANIA